MHLFGAIDVGSYVMEMKVFELSRKNGIRQIDDLRHMVDLGTDTYNTGKISRTHIEEVKRILIEFKSILNNYGVEGYRAYGTSAFREMRNASVITAQIEQETGIRIDVLGNAEQRFMDYKSVAFKGTDFGKVLEQSTAIVDIGGGSIQISLFEKDRLVATQNLKLGVLRLHEQLEHIGAGNVRNEVLIEEIVSSQFQVFKKLYLKDRDIKNIIVIDDYISDAARNQNLLGDLPESTIDGISSPGEFISVDGFNRFTDRMKEYTIMELSRKLNMSDDNIPLLQISAVMVRYIARVLKADMIWVPGVTLCDGIVYDYAMSNKYISSAHDFEQDILACAMQISKRYKGSEEREKTLEKIATQIFDSMKKIHGMGKRERLLLQLCTTLHDCGKYISMTQLADCSYNIIMATEIIGLSRREREIVANVVKYNHSPFIYYEEVRNSIDLSHDDYMIMTKLTAILRVANGLDRSHKKKFTDFKVRLRDGQLLITVSTKKDITLEKGMFGKRADFFEEIFSVRPVIRQKNL